MDTLDPTTNSPVAQSPNGKKISGAAGNSNTGGCNSRTDFSSTTPDRYVSDFSESNENWFWETDEEHRFTWISDNYERIHGIKRSLFYGRRRTDINDTLQSNNLRQHHQTILDSHKSFKNFEYRFTLPNGDSGWASTSGVPYFDGDGKFLGYRGTASNVTVLKDMERSAQIAAQQLRHAAEHLPGGLILFDHSDKIILCSEQIKNYLPELEPYLKVGTTRKKLLKAQLASGMVQEAKGSEELWFENQLRLQTDRSSYREVKRGDFWFRITTASLPGGGCLKMLLNITDRKKAELLIEKERNLLRSLVDNLTDIIYAKDLDSNFTFANKAASDFMLGLNPEHTTLIGKTDMDFHPTEVAEKYRADELNLLESGQMFEEQIVNVTNTSKGENYWVGAKKSPLKDKQGNIIGLVGVSRDITKQQLLHIELAKSQQRFKDFAETAADWLWECDSNLNINYLSDNHATIVDDFADKVIGKNLLQYKESIFENPKAYRLFHQFINNQKPFNNIEITLEPKAGGKFYYSVSGKPVFDESGDFSGYRGVVRDTSQAKLLQIQLAYRAHHDMLTGLPNRECFQKELQLELEQVQNNTSNTVIGYLDLDQFKIVNDTTGHQAGDQLLCHVARILENSMHSNHLVARLGGDEFGLLFRDCNIKQAESLSKSILEQLSAYRFNWQDRVFDVGGSIGIVPLDAQHGSTGEVMSRADMACYAAKEHGRNRCHVYTENDRELMQRQNEMLAATGIRSALEHKQFILYMQPITRISEKSDAISHYEILLRMLDDAGNIVPPGAFIPAAERYGLMGEIDQWVIQAALASFNEVFRLAEEVGITINLSGSSMSDSSLFKYIQENLERYSVDPTRVCFEITETNVINNMSIAKQFMKDIKQLGCSLALDDFGSGLSSFTYLKHFDVDFLKIDGSFVRDLATDPTDRVVVTAINTIGHGMNMQTIAEFVEDEKILGILNEMGVDYAQGYGIGVPVPYESHHLGIAVQQAA